MTLIKYLANLGYGSRRDVTHLVRSRHVTTPDGHVVRDGDAWTHETLLVYGAPLDPPPGSVVLLHKPVGYVTSSQDVPPLVYELLPARFLKRSPVMAPVGRLDRDTSGLLLFTDDGALNHRLTSPKSQVAKVYRATLADPLRGDEAEILASGTLMLRGDDAPVAPAALRAVDDRVVELTLHEGRYHQVRRMCAAIGHHVTALHRSALGPLALGDLGSGAWRVLTADERAKL